MNIILIVLSTIVLLASLYTDNILNFFAKPKVVELAKIELDDNRQNFYHGKLNDERLVQVRCRFGYVEVLVSINRKKKHAAKCILTRYFEERKHSCKMGFDDALYFLKKAGFSVRGTELIYRDEGRTKRSFLG